LSDIGYFPRLPLIIISNNQPRNLEKFGFG
jgi:hypothetical protein